MKTLVILEHKDDIDTFLKFKKPEHEYTVIAVTPGVCWELEKREIKYHSIASFWNEVELVKIGMENFYRVENICNEIDTYLQDQFSYFSQYNISPAMNDYFFAKILFDALSLRIAMLYSILKKECPDKIIVFSPISGNIRTDDEEYIFFSEEERIFTHILNLDAWDVPYQIIPSEKKYSVSPMKKSKKNITNNLIQNKIITKRNSILYNFLYCAKNFGMKSLFTLPARDIKNCISGNNRLLLVGFAYNWNYIVPQLYKNGYSVHHYSQNTDNSYEILSDIKIPVNIFQKFCNTKGISFDRLFKKFFISRLNISVSSTPHIIDNFEKVVEKQNPNAVLFGTKSNFQEHLIARLAKHYNIPVISWQHGAQGINYAPIMLYVELMNSDIHLCFGSGILDTLKNDLLKFPVNVTPIGSYELMEIYTKPKIFHPCKYKILYATTNYCGNNLHIGSPSILDDNDLWHTQKEILKALVEIETSVAFKIHPGQLQEEHIREYMSNGNYKNIEVFKNEKKYLNLLSESEIVVIDFPSTTLLQAIAAKKTIFVLLKHLTITDEAKKILRKRAYCSENINEFTDMIRRYLNNEPIEQQPSITNTEFLEQYGIHKLDAKIDERAIKILENEMNK